MFILVQMLFKSTPVESTYLNLNSYLMLKFNIKILKMHKRLVKTGLKKKISFNREKRNKNVFVFPLTIYTYWCYHPIYHPDYYFIIPSIISLTKTLVKNTTIQALHPNCGHCSNDFWGNYFSGNWTKYISVTSACYTCSNTLDDRFKFKRYHMLEE